MMISKTLLYVASARGSAKHNINIAPTKLNIPTIAKIKGSCFFKFISYRTFLIYSSYIFTKFKSIRWNNYII